MMSLDNAEKYQILNKESVVKYFEELGGTISQNGFTNYNTSDLSLTSIFEMNYFILEGKNKYYDIRGLFPKMLNNNQIPLIDILKKIDREIYWVGNEWAYCKPKNLNENIR